ncbi:hypothetical protein K2173_015364 [Erythroxylum novogranatense]|uniref:Uncharacterized protein n=1 Tax=Erythroxylum novogranatense TaxID=1862640 RepID=A0AAV8SRD7_9ROSI|nr:hypothetical protein K2173_015364 [Erythroxylum novogranatense]
MPWSDHISPLGVLIFSRFMSQWVFFLFLTLLLIPTTVRPQSNEDGYISVLLSQKGLNLGKDVLINKAVSSMIPLQVTDIEKSVKIPLIGKVQLVLSNIEIYSVNVASSYVETGETGVVLAVSGATANLSMKWKYSYRAWIVVISDHGEASIRVKGMEVGVNGSLTEQAGSLKLSLLDCWCHVKDISIEMDGGASWLYQVVVNAFQAPIRSAIEKAVSKKLREGIGKLDSRLQSLPKQIPVDHVAALNVTFVDNPRFSNSSVGFKINGLFTAVDKFLLQSYQKGLHTSASCNTPAKMIGILMDEDVFNTAALVHFNAGYMHWEFDEFRNQSLLNTSAWKYLYPELYSQYPDDNINLNITVTSPPVIRILESGIDATICLDVTVEVLDAGEVIPVASVSLVIDTSCSPQILRNRLAGVLKLKTFHVSPKWSKIGDLHMQLVQSVTHAFLKTIFLPYVNLRLMKGFPLPVLHGFTLQNTDIHYEYSKMVICSNLDLE